MINRWINGGEYGYESTILNTSIIRLILKKYEMLWSHRASILTHIHMKLAETRQFFGQKIPGQFFGQKISAQQKLALRDSGPFDVEVADIEEGCMETRCCNTAI